jgi:hypothetical protein
MGGASASLPRALGTGSAGGDASPRAVCDDGATYSTWTVRRLVSRVVLGFSVVWLIGSRFVWSPPCAEDEAACDFVGSRTEALLARAGCGSNVSSSTMSARFSLTRHKYEGLLE